MTTYKELFTMNMDEICNLATEGKWELEKLEAVCAVKTAQFLEIIAYQEVYEE